MTYARPVPTAQSIPLLSSCFSAVFRSFSFVRPSLPDEDATKLGNKSGSYLSHSLFHGQSDLHAVPRRGLHRGVRNRLLLHTLHLYDRQRHCTVDSAHYQLQFRFGIPRKGSANRKNSPTDFRILWRIRHRRIHSLLPNTDKNIHRPAQPCRPTGHSGYPALCHGLPLLHPQHLTIIRYYQSVQRIKPAILLALARGFFFLILSFICLPLDLGTERIWLPTSK